MKFFVIDIGSNSVRLMESDGKNTISKTVKTTRLAKGMCDGILTADAIERTAQAVSFFYEQAKALGGDEIFVFATAAVRKAKNSKDFTDIVKQLCGAYVDVISGETEARLGYLGALGDCDGGVIDVGGASTEITVQKDGKCVYSKSVYVGAVSVTDNCGQDIILSKTYIDKMLEEFKSVPNVNYFAIGGTATSIAAMLLQLEVYDPKIVNGYEILVNDLKNLVEKLFSLSVEQRKSLKGLHPDRAEVIANGALILLSVMQRANVDKIIVSESDNLEGYLKIKRK